LNRTAISTASQVDTGPRVISHSELRWKAYGYDLALASPAAFERTKLDALIDAFGQAVASRKNATLIEELRSWAANPSHSRWMHKSNCSLLRWVTTSMYKSTVPHSLRVWTYMFGVPAPTWYVWDQSKRAYQFDAEGWRVWFESLNQRG
jgi:hypothetical protein